MSVTKQKIAFMLAQQDDEVIAGNANYTSNVSIVGSLSVGDYFGVTASNGNLTVNTNKFKVAGSTGNTVIAGTASVAGALTASAAVTVGTTLGVTGNATLTNISAISLGLSGNLTGTNLTTSGYNIRSVGNALTAVGTTRADALQLAKEVNNVTTAAASTGVILPVGVVGMRIRLFNAGANAIKVYASASETIDTVAGATGVTLTNAKRADFEYVAANTWVSCQLGVVAA